MTLIEAINSASGKLTAAGISNARRDAEVLLCHALGRDRAWLLAHIREALDEGPREVFERTVERRARREPLQYITGKQEFWGLDFLVTPEVLIPRPETELIIEAALHRLQERNKPLGIIDLCTGSGCIAVSLATELPQARLIATDRSAKALAVARENACRHGVSDRIRFLEGDLFEPLKRFDRSGQADIIVSNPPYIASGDREKLQPEVRDFEPALALFAGPDGTELHRPIIETAHAFLTSGGALIMEMGIGQARALEQAIRETRVYDAPDVLTDLAGIERVVVAVKK